MRRQCAQRPQLPADQTQLRLHQALTLIDFIGHLLERVGQRFLLIALDGNRGFARQALGDFVDAGRQFHARAFDQLFAHILW
ncbi:hypothetical protein D3C73_1238740 [compost metagenome]